jgi:uncharacterized membrane protein YsdA (DUF1294 family)
MVAEKLLYWLIFANFIGFAAMIWDKAKAESGRWRISEKTLIMWSVIGGSFGVLAAAIIIRHKTRKQPMATIIKMVPFLHIGLGFAWNSGHADPLFAMIADVFSLVP